MPLSLETKPYFYKAMQTVAEKEPAQVAAFKQQVTALESTLDRIAADDQVDLAELTGDFAKLYSSAAGLNGLRSVFLELVAKAVEDVAPRAKAVLTSAHSAFSAASFKETAAVAASFTLGNSAPNPAARKLMLDGPVVGREAGDEVTDARIVGDTLELDVRYSGGFAQHEFGLSWNGMFAQTAPPQVDLTFSHDGHGDPAESIKHPTLKFDLSELKKAYAERAKEPTGAILLNIAGSTVKVPPYIY